MPVTRARQAVIEELVSELGRTVQDLFLADREGVDPPDLDAALCSAREARCEVSNVAHGTATTSAEIVHAWDCIARAQDATFKAREFAAKAALQFEKARMLGMEAAKQRARILRQAERACNIWDGSGDV